MVDEGPKSKAEIQEIFRRLRTISANRVCFDCNAKNPTWASVTYGVFICIDCSAVHRSLGVHLTFVRSTQLDTSWTWTQLRNMQLGGNGNASAFFNQHHCSTSDAQQKYNSRAAQLYREKLNQTVAKYNKLHGNKIVFDGDDNTEQEQEKLTDFFEEIQSAQESVESMAIVDSARLFGPKSSRNGAEKDEEGPNVESVLSPSSQNAASGPRKSTIGQRKPGNKMLGAKKGGLGAQKVKADFSEIEKEAQKLDQMKERQDQQAKFDAEQRVVDEEKQMASMSLAYKDISKMQQKRADQFKNADPKKAEQVERLGMGFGVRSGVSHSAISDMKTIDQETPAYSSRGSSNSLSNQRKFDPFFEEYDAEPTGFVASSESMRYKSTPPRPPSLEWEVIESSPPHTRSQSKEDDYRPKTREPLSLTTATTPSYTDDARQKFGNAKAISSDQFFSGSKDNDYERKANLSRFEGQSSISSADYFGDGRQKPLPQSSSFQTLQNVDLDDVKESVRQGVTKVAGKLSNLANGVMSSLHEKYGY